MTKEKYQCLICFENTHYPAILYLKCECQYNVHYKCYNKWWKMKRTCIICHKLSNKPRSYNSFKDHGEYWFLLDLNNKPNTNEKSHELIKNKSFHSSVIILVSLFIYFINANFTMYFSFYFIYFLLIIP